MFFNVLLLYTQFWYLPTLASMLFIFLRGYNLIKSPWLCDGISRFLLLSLSSNHLSLSLTGSPGSKPKAYWIVGCSINDSAVRTGKIWLFLHGLSKEVQDFFPPFWRICTESAVKLPSPFLIMTILTSLMIIHFSVDSYSPTGLESLQPQKSFFSIQYYLSPILSMFL